MALQNRLALILGVMLLLARAFLPWTEFRNGGAHWFDLSIPVAVYFATPLLGLGFIAWRLVRFHGIAWDSMLLVAILVLCTSVGTWFLYFRDRTFALYELRPFFAFTFGSLGTLLVASSVWHRLVGVTSFLKTVSSRRLVLCSAGICLFAPVLIYVFPLGNVPHIYDGITYLTQARVLASGQIYLPAMQHPELLTGTEGIAFYQKDDKLYGKYPLGWPMILAVFERFSARALANAVLSAGLVFWTFVIGIHCVSRFAAALGAMIIGLAPWMWFNAATGMSHVASAFWLHAFLGCYLTGLHATRYSFSCFALSGVALGMSILTRPQDAFAFALPIALFTTWLAAKRVVAQRDWIFAGKLAVLASGAFAGLLGHVALNRLMTGGHGSAYRGGSGIVENIFRQAPSGLLEFVSWNHQVFSDVNTLSLGLVPIMLPIGFALLFAKFRNNYLGLLIAANVCLCLLYSIFVFGGRSWVGPRWLFPILPTLCLLVGSLIDYWSNSETCSSNESRRVLRIVCAWTICSILIASVAIVIPKCIELYSFPPHAIGPGLEQLIKDHHLANAVVGIEGDSGWDGEKYDYLCFRNGIVLMTVPFTESPVVFVQAVEGWQEKAYADFPGRQLYLLNRESRSIELLKH